MKTAYETAHSDLVQNFDWEVDGKSVFDCTRDAVLEGSIALDPRNFHSPDSLRILVRAKLIKKFGGKQEGVQYYILTPLGWNSMFPSFA